jgi:UDP-glucose-4-epimerase GalE
MRILVTGGAGYIGSHTCKTLAQAGYLPITYDNLSTGHRWAVRWGPLVEGDLRDTTRLVQTLRAYNIEAVFHFAANSLVGESQRNPRKYYHNNLVNSLGLLDAMLDAGVQQLVFSSTCATYGEPQAESMDEDHPQRPVNPYGESKLAIERALHWYSAAYGLQYAALRYFNAAGASADGEIGEAHDPETHLIPLVLEAAMNPERPISIFGTDYPTPDGTAIRDYIHVEDLADAHVLALRYLAEKATSDAFNLGTGAGYSVREVIAEAEAATGRRVAFVEDRRRDGDPPRLIAAASRAQTELQWAARRSMAEMIQSAWKWMLKMSCPDSRPFHPGAVGQEHPGAAVIGCQSWTLLTQ